MDTGSNHDVGLSVLGAQSLAGSTRSSDAPCEDHASVVLERSAPVSCMHGEPPGRSLLRDGVA